MDQSEVHPLRAYRLGQTPIVRLEDLAERVGTTKTTLSEIENGKRPVSLELLPKLRAETGIPADKLRPDVAEMFKVEAAE